MKQRIEALYNQQSFSDDDRQLFLQFRAALDAGEIRAAEKCDGEWVIHHWVKRGILAGFRMGAIVPMPSTTQQQFLDKETYPPRWFTLQDGVRMVPGGSAVRTGCYVAPSVIMMPPMYINVGAYVDSGSMIDSHALVGTCAQVGKGVHLSAGAMLGGVLEPIGANPVIIEDNVFIGGNCGLYEGVIVQESAIIAAGVIITGGSRVYDAVYDRYLQKDGDAPLVIPAGAVVVPGSRPLRQNPEFSVACPIIIKYRDAKTNASVTLEDALR
jgi:2,3,4,5-tetrahydropyridine-2-carboxylate N-succinyltransferase